MTIKYLNVILVSQLAGEVLGVVTNAPIPGPVIGMAFLFLALVFGRFDGEGIDFAARGLLSNLGLLFVPAGVGVMVHLPRLGAEYPAIGAALIVSTVVTIAVTGVVMQSIARRLDKGETR